MTERTALVLPPIRVRAKIPGSMQDVFAYVSDPTNDPQWVDTTPAVAQETGKGPAVGSTYTYTQTVGRTLEGTIEITEMDPPTWMAFRVQDPYRDYQVTYELKPATGGVRLEQTSHPKLFLNLGWKRLLVPFMTRKQLRKQMRALKQVMRA